MNIAVPTNAKMASWSKLVREEEKTVGKQQSYPPLSPLPATEAQDYKVTLTPGIRL